jgi:hypothetical protein
MTNYWDLFVINGIQDFINYWFHKSPVTQNNPLQDRPTTAKSGVTWFVQRNPLYNNLQFNTSHLARELLVTPVIHCTAPPVPRLQQRKERQVSLKGFAAALQLCNKGPIMALEELRKFMNNLGHNDWCLHRK